MNSGTFKLTGFDLATHFDEDMMSIEKYNPEMIISAVYFDGKLKKYYVKRFSIEHELNGNRLYNFIGDHSSSKLIAYSFDRLPQIEVEFDNSERKKPLENELINIAEFIGVKGFKAKGKRVSPNEINKVSFIDPLPFEDEIISDEDDVTKEKPEGVNTEELHVEEQNENKQDKDEKINSNIDDSQMTLEF